MREQADLEALMRPMAMDCLERFDPESASSQETLERILSVPVEPGSRPLHSWRGGGGRLALTGLRQAALAPLRARSRLLLPVLAMLVTAAGAAAAVVSLSGRSTAPVTLAAGNQALCPMDSPYLADRSQGLEYPPNYPGPLPTGTHGLRCYTTEQDAINAGFRPAPAPAGGARSGAVYLATPTAAVRAACRAATHKMHATVYCPTLLPAQWSNPRFHGDADRSWRDGIGADCPSRGCAVPVLSIWGSFPTPPTWFSSPFDFSSLEVWEMTDAQQRRYLYLRGCDGRPGRPGRLLGHTTFDGTPATWYGCSSFAAYSTELVWHRGDDVIGVSASGSRPQGRQLDRYVAEHLQPQAPES